MAKNKITDNEEPKRENLESLLGNLKSREKARDLNNALQTDNNQEALKEAAPIAYEAGRNAPIPIYNETIKPEELDVSEVSEGLGLKDSDLTGKIRGDLATKTEKILSEMDEEKFQKIATIGEVAQRAGEGYKNIFQAYRQYEQAQEIAKRDLKKLSREDMIEIYQAVAPHVERETAKKLKEQGRNADYAQRVARLAEAATRAGHLSSEYLEGGKEAYLAEAEKRLEDSGAKEKGRKYVAAVMKENDLRLNEGIAETIYKAYNPLKVEEKKKE